MSNGFLDSLTRTSEDHCPDCGAPVAGGRAGCQALWNEFSLQAYSDSRLAPVRDLAFDAYCMQHPKTYCRSSKSYAAHLTRLCCGVEYAGSPRVFAAIRGWLDGRRDLAKPEPPDDLGTMTIASLLQASSREGGPELVRAWAGIVWKAYAAQHDLARAWIREALETRSTPRKKTTHGKI